MDVIVTPIGSSAVGEPLHREGESGWVYDDWRLSAASREKMKADWPTLDLAWVDLAARAFESAWSQKDSNENGFVGWREDIDSVAYASAKLLKALEGCAFPAQHSLGTMPRENGETALYDKSVEIVAALINATKQLQSNVDGMDARKLSHPMPELIIKLARQLRYAELPWDRKFQPALTRLTTLTLDGLNIRHSLDIRSSVKDTLKSGDQRLVKLR